MFTLLRLLPRKALVPSETRKMVSAVGKTLLDQVFKSILVVLSRFKAPPSAVLSVSELLHSLDSWDRPGVPTNLFKEIVVECDCGMTVTRRMFRMHECIAGKRVTVEVIDLTLNE